ncbi:hypothetical protein AAE021_12385 [Arthrobacter citreus]|uniref:ACP S-malonyltransferase n=1 Tax=Arthrobacter citreus TaxID=1670 RepID=A0ABZ2ZT60_9MICC
MLALLFSGLVPNKQPNVYELLESVPYGQNLVEQAEAVLGPDLLERHREAEIYDWNIYQTVYMIEHLVLAATWEQLTRRQPDLLAGQSFGSLTAAVHAGCLSFREMVELITRSTQVEETYFSEAEAPLACVFYARLSQEMTDRLITDVLSEDSNGWLDISVVQERGVFSVSGTASLVHRFGDGVRRLGGIIFYTVERAEHCPALSPLADRLEEEVYSRFKFQAPSRLLLSDNGKRLSTGPEVSHDLARGWSRRLVNAEQYQAMLDYGVKRMVIPGHSALFSGPDDPSFEKLLIRSRDYVRKAAFKDFVA